MTGGTPHRRLASVGAAIAAALLFGVSTPCAKVLVGGTSPVLVAGLLYAGAALGLTLIRLAAPPARRGAGLTRAQIPWLTGSVLIGGVLGPVFLMSGLARIHGSTASLLLNLEGVFTTLLAWFLFHENFDRRIALGFLLIVAGAIVLGFGDSAAVPSAAAAAGAGAITAACLCWAVDNNLHQRISSADPLQIAAFKCGVAGGVNLALGHALGGARPSVALAGITMGAGFLGYGVSLAFFSLALRHLGAARTSAYFSLAPFFGAGVSIVALGEPVGWPLVAAALLMTAGVWLHLTERHEHEHRHDRLVHSHRHVHDEHHRHDHEEGQPADEPHTHLHVHEPMTHRHPHYPDIHHRHRH